MKKKKNAAIPAVGVIAFAIVLMAVAMILVSTLNPDIIPSIIPEIPSGYGEHASGDIYDNTAAAAVENSAEYKSYQGLGLNQTSKRMISEGVYEYTFLFSSGSINRTPPVTFTASVRAYSGHAEVLAVNMVTGFCGSSSYDSCSGDSDCATGGCSGQVCQSTSAEPVITTCIYKDCYNAQLYEVVCKCYKGKCQWI